MAQNHVMDAADALLQIRSAAVE